MAITSSSMTVYGGLVPVHSDASIFPSSKNPWLGSRPEQGINGSISYGPLSPPHIGCEIPVNGTANTPPPLSGSILVRSRSGEETFIPIDWVSLSMCDFDMGIFQVLLRPGKYTVDFSGYKGIVSMPPVTVVVKANRLTQVSISIDTGIL